MEPFLSYDLPKEKIASRPTEDRPSAKLLSIQDESMRDLFFSDIGQLLEKGDLLVLNDSRVRPCRFFVTKAESSTQFEILLVNRLTSADSQSEGWQVMAKPMKKLKSGDRLIFSKDVSALVGERSVDPSLLKIEMRSVGEPLHQALENLGLMPIPPYIRKGKSDDLDTSDYQTIYAKARDSTPGSLAAPTAGLHFDEKLLSEIEKKQVEIAYLTLEVGLSSVKAISERDLDGNELPVEYFSLGEQFTEQLEQCKERGGRVVAVGTTCVRSLESAALAGLLGEKFASSSSSLLQSPTLVKRPDGYLGTNLFIRPGFKFSVVDHLVTNFHLPNSTHLLLVNAFSNSTNIAKIYRHALENNYRFFSYGDAMFL